MSLYLRDLSWSPLFVLNTLSSAWHHISARSVPRSPRTGSRLHCVFLQVVSEIPDTQEKPSFSLHFLHLIMAMPNFWSFRLTTLESCGIPLSLQIQPISKILSTLLCQYSQNPMTSRTLNQYSVSPCRLLMPALLCTLTGNACSQLAASLLKCHHDG